MCLCRRALRNEEPIQAFASIRMHICRTHTCISLSSVSSHNKANAWSTDGSHTDPSNKQAEMYFNILISDSHSSVGPCNRRLRNSTPSNVMDMFSSSHNPTWGRQCADHFLSCAINLFTCSCVVVCHSSSGGTLYDHCARCIFERMT